MTSGSWQTCPCSGVGVKVRTEGMRRFKIAIPGIESFFGRGYNL